MVKFATIVDGRFMVYTMYGQSNCTKKPVLGDRSEPISTDEFYQVQAEAKKHKETYYEETVK